MKLEALIAARAKDGPNQSPKSSPAMRPEQRTATTEAIRFMLYCFESRLLSMSTRCDRGLTRRSSAAASESAAGNVWKHFNHDKGGNKPARRRLQRLVR